MPKFIIFKFYYFLLKGPKEGNTTIFIKGKNFINSELFSLKFGDSFSSNLIWYNSTMISVVTPPSFITGKFELFFSLNKINYYPMYYFNKEKINEKIYFNYYEEIEILSITPKFGFYNSDIEILIRAFNVIENEFLRCNIDDQFVTYVIGVSQDNIYYNKCIIPHIDDISIEYENIFMNNTLSNIKLLT